ncbi:ribosome biogenesis/translation initiation ATPase RLI [Candidatus Micrarchaeota archaeon]|nr:ribosome biogenesis/translation initiation ATPase RLI [Candidatus Micrarchaeota archaeon]
MASKKRIAIVDAENCDCNHCALDCIKACPINRTGAECIILGDRKKTIGGLSKIAVIDENLCTGCGICVKRCPYEAITIINLPHELENVVHQYGKNAFRVYRFPSAKKGVVGLVGPNGIGKSTLLNIMAGALVPNLGDYEHAGDWQKVIDAHKGSEMQNYFEKLSENDIRLSYKPQEVSRIPTYFKGTVEDLLYKADENGEVDGLVKELEITGCLDHKISEVSGGELQRIAIIATMGKDADYYFFDEPSSYLDVRQRLNAARVIKKLGETKNVIAVEHDLAVLDYLADYVHVLYGKPGAYGVVSTLKSARVGINEFLDGFLKAENTRIRDYSIRFEVRPPGEAWKSKQKFAYNAFEKDYKSFSLRAEAGELVRGEVVGILGPNAIGKSTYMKVMAGVEKPDVGEPNFAVRVSYKPQYIDFEDDVTVSEYIYSINDFDRDMFEAEIKPIVADLFEKRLKKLSGGEAQRVAIAAALSKKCDVALLDEPSAFLDIEQRFRLSHIIKRMTEKKEITTLTIDHDILFQDLVSNRVMVFEGTPGKSGHAKKPEPMSEGMNDFLSTMKITFRRDPDSGRPRMNKPGSQMDEEQKKSGKYYYVT